MVLKTCRCCCGTMRLEKAAKIIGIILTICAAISVVTSAVRLNKLDEIELQLGELAQNEDIQQVFAHSRNLLVARLCGGILFTVFSAILVVGVYSGSKRLVLTFVIFFVLYLAVNTIVIFYAFYDPTSLIDQASIDEFRKQSEGMAKAVIYTSLAIVLATYAFSWYLAVVVYSYYKEMAGSAPTQEHHQMC